MSLRAGGVLFLLQGLPVEDLSDEDAPVLLWGVGQYLGIPEPQDKAGALLHVVTDTGAESIGQTTFGGFRPTKN